MKSILSSLALITLILSATTPVVEASESNSVTCLCKCTIHWFSSRIGVTPASVGLSEDADRIDVISRSGVACRTYCEKSELAKYGDVMNFGYRAGVCL